MRQYYWKNLDETPRLFNPMDVALKTPATNRGLGQAQTKTAVSQGRMNATSEPR